MKSSPTKHVVCTQTITDNVNRLTWDGGTTYLIQGIDCPKEAMMLFFKRVVESHATDQIEYPVRNIMTYEEYVALFEGDKEALARDEEDMITLNYLELPS
jgi:hypothetical protein